MEYSRKNKVLRMLALAFIGLAALFLLIGVIEIYDVLFGDASAYPFGAECAPWYYETPTTYLVIISIQTIAAAGIVVGLMKALKSS